jgi:hypothetical protein
MSSIHVDPDLAVELFVLEPLEGSEEHEPSAAQAPADESGDDEPA